ncbi:hypothetical protein DRO26_04665, partial [Candidatus Bathyarchaeota archaeon]
MTTIRKRTVKQYYQKFYYKDETTGEIKKGYKNIYTRIRYYLEFPSNFPLHDFVGKELELQRKDDVI